MKKMSGIRSRWLTHNVSLMVLLVLACAVAGIVALSSYYYSCMRNGLEAQLKTTADFFETYISNSQEEFYGSVYSFTQNYEGKNDLELEFLNSGGEIISSSFGLASGSQPETEDVKGALEQQKLSSFQGKDPQTGERILAVSSMSAFFAASGVMGGGPAISLFMPVTRPCNVDMLISPFRFHIGTSRFVFLLNNTPAPAVLSHMLCVLSHELCML